MNGTGTRRTAALAVFAACSVVLLCGADCDFDIRLPWFDMEDTGGYWEKGVLDADLSGVWFVNEEDGEAQATRFRKQDDVYALEGRRTDEQGRETWEGEALARTLQADGHRFLLFKDSPQEEGDDEPGKKNRVNVWHYTLDKGVLTFHGLKEGVLERAAEDKRWEGVLEVTRKPRKDPKEGEPAEKLIVRVPRLDEKTVVFLKWLADDRANWDDTDAMVFTRKPIEKPKAETPVEKK